MVEELEDETPEVLWNPSNAQILLEVLRDPYEENKSTALYLLRKFPIESLNIQNKDFTIHLMKMCLSLSQSIRPADSATAAYLLRFLVSFPEVETVWESLQRIDQELTSRFADQLIDYGNKSTLQCQAMHAFTHQLRKQLLVARTNIMAAAVEGPMYGTILCLRLLLEDCDLQTLNDYEGWRIIITQLIDSSYDAVAAVEHVVNSDSPEGHLPMDAQLFAELQKHNNQSVDTVSSICANVTAQQVLLCAWRTVKEASLLLGSLAKRVPLIDTTVSGSKGLLKENQLFTMGQHFIRLLAEVKHRGAFEQVYVGFTQLCTRLWSLGGKKAFPCSGGRDIALHALPASWLNELLSMVSSAGGSNVGTALCVTRRSAGVPFIVQALLGTEPSSATGETSVYPHCMEMLLHLAEKKDNSEAQTHALNILRAVFRNAILSERTAPYITHAVKVAVNGCHGKTWSVRNAATLLFATLMTRLFGVPSARDRQRLRKMTGRLFFHQNPTLYDFMLAELSPPPEKTLPSSSSEQGFQPFPALLLLSRLYPSSLEGMDSNLQLSSFIPLVQACAGCSMERTRSFAARALAPLVSPSDWHTLLIHLLDAAVSRQVSGNMRHGLLLQAVRLLQTFFVHFIQNESLQERILRWVDSNHWLLVRSKHKSSNFIVAEAYLQVVQELAKSILEKKLPESNVSIKDAFNKSLVESNPLTVKTKKVVNYPLFVKWDTIMSLMKEILELENNGSSMLPQPGQCLYQMRATQLLLTLTMIFRASELPSVLSHLVLSKSSETALTSLSFMLHIFKHTPLILPFEEDYEEKMELMSGEEVEKALTENSSLAHSVTSLLLVPEEHLHPDSRLYCFQLMTHLPLSLPCLVKLLPASVSTEDLTGPKEERPVGSEALLWLLRALEMDVERIGPAVVSVLDAFFSTPEDFVAKDVDLSLMPNDLQHLCTTLESASAPELPVELRYAVACLISSPCTSKFLLHPNKHQEMCPLALCSLWTAALQLLDDDDAEVRRQAAALVLHISKSDNMPMTEARAREILVSAFVNVMAGKEPLVTSVTLTGWILRCCDVPAKELNSLEDQLFEQSEANDYGEPILLAEVSSSALGAIISESPDLVTSLIPDDAYTRLTRQCWGEQFLMQEPDQKYFSLQDVLVMAEERLISLRMTSTNQETTLLAPPQAQLGTLCLQLLQKALKLPLTL